MEDSLTDFRRRHIGRALARARWTFERQFADRIRERGFEDFRQSDVEIIARVPVQGGARLTDIAARAQVSKQAIAKMVLSLEERRYVTRRPDPNDGRAQRILLSARGRALLESARQAIDEIEQEWAELLTPTGLKRLRSALLKVADELGDSEFL